MLEQEGPQSALVPLVEGVIFDVLKGVLRSVVLIERPLATRLGMGCKGRGQTLPVGLDEVVEVRLVEGGGNLDVEMFEPGAQLCSRPFGIFWFGGEPAGGTRYAGEENRSEEDHRCEVDGLEHPVDINIDDRRNDIRIAKWGRRALCFLTTDGHVHLQQVHPVREQAPLLRRRVQCIRLSPPHHQD